MTEIQRPLAASHPHSLHPVAMYKRMQQLRGNTEHRPRRGHQPRYTKPGIKRALGSKRCPKQRCWAGAGRPPVARPGWRGCRRTHHGVLQQVLQPRQARVMVARILPFDGVLQAAQVGLRLPGVAEELQRQRGQWKPAQVRRGVSSTLRARDHPDSPASSSRCYPSLRAARAASIPRGWPGPRGS